MGWLVCDLEPSSITQSLGFLIYKGAWPYAVSMNEGRALARTVSFHL